MNCEREHEIVSALREGRMNSEIQAHVAHCFDCAEAAATAAFLLNEAETAALEADLPSADSIWWKANLDARRAALARATRPIAWIRNLACAAAAIVVLCLLLSGRFANLVQSAQSAVHLQSLTAGYVGVAALFGACAVLAVIVFGTLYIALGER